MTSVGNHGSSRLLPIDTRNTNRTLSRSPHPYFRRGLSLGGDPKSISPEPLAQDETSESSTERGTEADDEKGPILRGLPAPPIRGRKGLRGSKSPLDTTPAISPFPTPPAIEHDRSYFFLRRETKPQEQTGQNQVDKDIDAYRRYVRRRQAEIVRRLAETALLALIGILVSSRPVLTGQLHYARADLTGTFIVLAALTLLYPLRWSVHSLRHGSPISIALKRGFHIPSRFDLGPLLYPVFIPVLIAVSLIDLDHSMVTTNLVIGLASLPSRMIPLQPSLVSSTLHWILSLVPLFLLPIKLSSLAGNEQTIPTLPIISQGEAERLTLIFPLHQTLLVILKNLTTTSLDPAEIHLLSAGLINMLLFAVSPQAQILKAIMWVGTLCLFVSCHQALSWEIRLARIPTWKFTRNRSPQTGLLSKLENILVSLLPAQRYRQVVHGDTDDEDYEYLRSARKRNRTHQKLAKTASNGPMSDLEPQSSKPKEEIKLQHGIVRSATVPTRRAEGASPSKQQRRSTTSAKSPLLSLTVVQAQALKWLIAFYAYGVVLLIVLVPVRYYVGTYALRSNEPFGWAIGYLLGNISRFRFWIVSNNLERWIKLPDHFDPTITSTNVGWFETIRQQHIGPANLRLMIAGYCVVILTIGLGLVSQLRAIVEVDTRRKVFHGIMVAMLLPTIAVDPCFIALALTLILAIFLLLDLFRASQLPPISKPLTTFLAPYVDGRDYRGPVIVSHIFLLIGCAIPLWLTLAGSPRSGQDPWLGWETTSREVSMVSGVVCVGMGDAAASLIGRRYGRTKWFWGGGKSLEGSFAFAVAVTAGLMASYLWLRIGGWAEWNVAALPAAVLKAIVAASGASLLESVLTAANDNVVVPIGLWLLVRGLQI